MNTFTTVSIVLGTEAESIMGFKTGTLLVLLLQLGIIHSEYVSGTIKENTTFYYRMLPVTPAISTTIEFNISYLKSSMRDTYPLMGIYTEYPKINIAKRCSYIQHGQLRSENLHTYLRLSGYRHTRCELSGPDTVNCNGRFAFQDYIPRTFSLSFGFQCHWPRIYSLQGLSYNISFLEQSNDTSGCVDYSGFWGSGVCRTFYKETSLPNLIGEENLDRYQKYFKHAIYSEALAYFEGTCYQHLWEVACYVFLPKCDPDTELVTHPCREMCWDFVEGCWQQFLDVLVRLGSYSRFKNYADFMPSTDKQTLLNCDYLPSHYGSVPCFYKPVTCDSPPDVTNGTMLLNITQKDMYQLHDVLQYACLNESFEMKGNSSITCLCSGKWSHSPPVCEPVKHLENLVYILLPILLVCLVFLLVLFLASGIKHKRKLSHDLPEEKIQLDGILTQLTDNNEPLLDSKRNQESTLSLNSLPTLQRNREFDAFVLYHFDTDHDFVVDSLIPELKDTRHFKLLIHGIDFQPGRRIEENIETAIKSSNNAIILMSSGFTTSRWCTDEFTHCYIEHIDDPAFKMFVIMMDPVGMLTDLTPNMRRLLTEETYLEVDDPQLFLRLARYLRPGNDVNISDNDDH